MYELHPDDVLLYRGANPRTGRVSPFEATDGFSDPQCSCHFGPYRSLDHESLVITCSNAATCRRHTVYREEPNQIRYSVRTPILEPGTYYNEISTSTSLSTPKCPQSIMRGFELDRAPSPAQSLLHIPGAYNDSSSVSTSSGDSLCSERTEYAFKLSEVLPPVKPFIHPSEFSHLGPSRHQGRLRRLLDSLRFRRRTSKPTGEGIWIRAALAQQS